MKNFLVALVFFLTIFSAFSAEVLRNSAGKPVRYAGRFNGDKVVLQDYRPRAGEFRGVWVAVVENIDFPAHKTAYSFQQSFCRMLNNIKAAGFTAVIFQIRSNCDAFYPTRLAPWSRWLSGKEGSHIGKNFDPLMFMINETHRRGLEFHAWFNPYRVTNNTTLSPKAYLASLAPSNIARQRPHWVLCKRNKAGNQLFLDPGNPQVIDHLAAVVADVVRRYPVDAVHFDDYFYPYEKMGNEDAASFRLYNPRRLSLDNWRRSNTDSLIFRIRQTISRINLTQKRRVRFGVSPFGIWANKKDHPLGSLTGGKQTYSDLYANTRLWVKNNYVDYIAPQIYWNFGHNVAAYAALTDWWCRCVQGTNVKLYIGMAAYNGKVWNPNELRDQMRYNRMRKDISGAAFFSYRSFFGKESNPGASALLRYIRSSGRY